MSLATFEFGLELFLGLGSDLGLDSGLEFQEITLTRIRWYPLSSATGESVSGELATVFYIEADSDKSPTKQFHSAVKKGDEVCHKL